MLPYYISHLLRLAQVYFLLSVDWLGNPAACRDASGWVWLDPGTIRSACSTVSQPSAPSLCSEIYFLLFYFEWWVGKKWGYEYRTSPVFEWWKQVRIFGMCLPKIKMFTLFWIIYKFVTTIHGMTIGGARLHFILIIRWSVAPSVVILSINSRKK